MPSFRILPVKTSALTEKERREREKREERKEHNRAKEMSQKRNSSETPDHLLRVANVLINGPDRKQRHVAQVAAMRDMLATRDKQIKNADQKKILEIQESNGDPLISFRIGGKKYKKSKKQNKRKTKRKKLTKRR